MKRIVFFTTSSDYKGGAIMCLIEAFKYVNRNDIEPFFIVSKRGSTEKVLEEMHIPYKYIRCSDWLQPEWIIKSNKFKFKRPLQILSNILAEIRIYFFLKKGKFDGYHLNSIYSGVGVRAAHALKIPVFWHLREFVDENPWTSTFINERYSYSLIEKSYKLLAVSNSVKAYYQTKMPRANFEVVYDGVEFSTLNNPRKEICFHSPLRLSMVGGVVEVKGHEDAIRASAILKNKNIPFIITIYGRNRDGGYMQRLNSLINELGVSDVIQFAGYRNDMKHVWNETDICLVCSKSESFGRITVEAMCQNIPVIGADNSGTHELIGPDTVGLQYRTGNPEDLSNKIVEIMHKNYNQKELDRNQNYVQQFSSKSSAKRLVEVLTKI